MRGFALAVLVSLPGQAFAQEPAACAPVAPLALVSPVILGDGTPGSVTTGQIQAALDAGCATALPSRTKAARAGS